MPIKSVAMSAAFTLGIPSYEKYLPRSVASRRELANLGPTRKAVYDAVRAKWFLQLFRPLSRCEPSKGLTRRSVGLLITESRNAYAPAIPVDCVYFSDGIDTFTFV